MLLEKLYLKRDLVLSKQKSIMVANNFLFNTDGKETHNRFTITFLKAQFLFSIDLRKMDQICMEACFIKFYIMMS